MSNYTIFKLEYIYGLQEENVPPKAIQIETYPAVHPTLASARAVLDQIIQTDYHPYDEVVFQSLDMAITRFIWSDYTSQRLYGRSNVETRIVFWIEEES